MMSELLRYPYHIMRPLYERTRLHTYVIDEVSNPDLQQAYIFCRRITRDYAKTFYLATRFLPVSKQRSIFAIYALCRYLDTLIDEGRDLVGNAILQPSEVEEAIHTSRQTLINTYEGNETDNPIFLSFADVLKSHNIPVELPLSLIDGVKMDLTKNRYETFEELYEYSYKVASVVGLMTSEVFGYESKEALKHAVDLGIAMQLTNIIRDIGEDMRNDRIYLPQEDLRRFNITHEHLRSEIINEPFRRLMKLQIHRTRKYYQSADRGIAMLNPDSRLPVYLARYNYSRILTEIEKNDYQVFQRRASLSLPQKLFILPKIWWRL